ncbi:MAG: Rpn family recombination-promoting nuclease/putative transposase, partial [Verrucomicrobiales bacterium]
MPDPFNPLKFGHDKLAKLGFSDPVNAASVLQSYLPPDIVSEVDWSSLKSEPTSFVSGQLEGSAADLLYSARLCQGSEIKIYVLLEHQSTVDGWMPLRLLGYMTQIWQASRKQDPEAKTLPLILPVVLFQGPKEWNVVTHLGGLIADWETLHPSMQRSIPDLHYSVIDLSRMKPGEMTGTTAARAVLEMLKGAAEGNLLETVRRCLPLLAALLQKGGQEAELVRAMWIYIMNVDGSAGMKDVQGVLERSQHPELEGNYM